MYPVIKAKTQAKIATIISERLQIDAIIAAIVPMVAVMIFPVE